ncbi:MAG TPA: DNA ligase D, partial [Pirellulales bacterium]|nr:DNA ligase D [Pirellulales bacterium]
MGTEWLNEIKFDGYRMLCRIDSGRVSFISRNDQEWTAKFKPLAVAAAELPVDTALLDGEVVVMEPDGTTSFQALQNAFKTGASSSMVYFAFDLLHLDGWDTAGASLEDRKKLLAEIVTERTRGPIRYSEEIEGSGAEFFKAACKAHLEGIICKRRDLPYSPGRGYDWLKVKCHGRDEFVIGGYTSPSGHRTGFGALLIGYHNQRGDLLYAGKVGTGFDERTLRDLHTRLKKLEQKSSPFANLIGSTGEARGAHWVEPKLVAQIEFTEWTSDRRLRHPSYQGLREDKPASQVVRDEATPVDSAVAASHHATSSNYISASHEEKTTMATKRTTRHVASSNGAAKNGAAKDSSILGVVLTHPDKVLWPDGEVTKRQLAEYYDRIADWMLPHVEGRPAVLVRCPEGQRKTCFYQKHPGKGLPIEMRQVPIREKDSTGDYVVLEKAADLVAMAQMGVLEIHVWGSTADHLEKPDRLVFDLDPDPTVKWPQVV